MRNRVILVLSGDALSKVLLLSVNVLLIRALSVSAYASFTLLFTVLMLGYQLACAAIERLYIADFERFSPLAARILVVSVAGWAGILSLYLYWAAPDPDFVLFFSGLAILSAYQFERIKLQQQQLFRQFSAVEVIKNGGWCLFVIGGIYLGGVSTRMALGGLIAAAGLGVVYMRLIASRDRKLSGSTGDTASLVPMIRESGDVFLYTLLAAVMPYLPVFLVNLDAQEDTLATYGAAMRYQGIMGMVVYALNAVYLPTVAKASSAEEAKKLALKFYRALPVAALLAVMAIVGVAICIPIIDGGRYPMTPYVFSALAICGFFSLVAIPAVNHLLSKRRYRQILISITSGIVATCLVFLAIKELFATLGAALASLAGYAVANAMLTFYGLCSLAKKPD